ncbi:hypothetical protein GCM10007937_50770 [Mesorhizobium albiziae]|nr:hypothetical protein GCM10007937_50770 [Mesorhizobium albiziae]
MRKLEPFAGVGLQYAVADGERLADKQRQNLLLHLAVAESLATEVFQVDRPGRRSERRFTSWAVETDGPGTLRCHGKSHS